MSSAASPAQSNFEERSRKWSANISSAFSGKTGGVVSAAAIRLAVPRTTLNAMMQKLGISRKDL